jgi:EmrB/QacA subfamily drug resistance transporter
MNAETQHGALGLDRKWWTLIAVCTGMFMLLLDITVVNVALPDIQKSLHSSFADLEWVVNAYALSLAALLLTFGSIADLLGRRRMFVIGLVVFTIASLLCGLSTSALMLNLMRAVQGVGGAIMFATSLALVAAAFHGRERGTAFGVYGAVIGAAVAVGPLVGGALTSAVGWEWIFFVNVPIGIAAVVVARTQIAESKDPEARGVDWLGLVTFSGGLFLFVLSLIEGNDRGWGSTEIVAGFAGAVVLLIAFVVVELKQERPMFDFGLLRIPSFLGASLVAFCLSSSMFSMFLYLTLYIQQLLGYGPLQAGLRFLPLTLLAFIFAPISGRLTVRVPVRAILGVGMLFVGVGLLLMTGLNASSSWTHLLPGFIVAGIGIGLTNPAIASTAVSVVPAARAGMASGINNTCRQVGISTGIAGLGAIYTHQLVSNAHEGHAAAFTGAMDTILLVAGITALIGAVAGVALVRARDIVPTGPGAAPAPVPAEAA